MRPGCGRAVLDRGALPTGETVAIHLEPGIAIGNVSELPRTNHHWGEHRPGTFADVDPVLATDTLSDLAQLSRHRR